MITWQTYWPQQVSGDHPTAEDMPSSLYVALCRSAARYPDKIAVVDHCGTAYTYCQLLHMTDTFAAALQKDGAIAHQSHVGILLYNGIEFCVAYLALNKIGAVAVSLPSKFQRPEVLSLAEKAHICAVITCDSFGSWFSDTACATILLCADDCKNWANQAAAVCSTPSTGQGDLSDAALLMFTSGTTSKSKGVLLRNRHIMHSIDAYIRTLHLTCDDVTLIATPIYHVTGLICIFSVFIAVGGTVYLQQRVDPSCMLRCFADNRVTFYHASPTVFAKLLEHSGEAPEIPSLTSFACGSGNMPPENILKLKRWLPHAQFHTVYGLTETAGAGTIIPGGAADSPSIGSSGVPMPDLQVRTIDENGAETPCGTVGEICLKGSFVIDRYYEPHDDRFDCGWLKTGDLGYYNDAGHLYIVDRKKDMINHGGEKVCSYDVENVLHTIAGIAEAAVVGVPDATYIEIPVAVIRCEKNCRFTAEEVQTILSPKLAKFKIPKRIEFVDEIPKTHNGKIDKTAIRNKMTHKIEGSC